MNFRGLKLFMGIFILLAFLSVGVFGLLQFSHTNHMTEAPMINCPYATGGSSICENTLSHIDNWQQFSNAILPSLTVLLLLIFTVLYILDQDFLLQEKHFYKWKYYLDNKKLLTYPDRIIKWLSLFENSPSLSYVRHN